MLASCIALAFLGTALAGPVRRDLPTATGSSTPIPSSIANSTNTTDINQLLLLPSVHWEHDSNDLNNLKPNQSHMIYFTPEGGNADPSVRHAFMQANITMQKPTVILDHCGSIKTVQCGKEGVSVVFNHKDAFDTAKSFWSSNFTLGTNTDDCGQLTHQSSFWDVKSLNFDENSLSVVATVDEEVDIGAHAEECEAAWGTWKPSENQPTAVSIGAAQITQPPSLQEREALDLGGLFGDATSALGSLGKGFVSDVKSLGNAGKSIIVSDVKSIVSVVTSAADIQTTVTGNIPLNAKPTSYDAAAPWPSAYKVGSYNGITGYCVDCWSKGNVHFAGSVSWNVLAMKVTKAQGDMSGNLEAQFIAGIDADGSVTLPSVSVTIFNPNVEQWAASSLLTVGPYFTIKAVLDSKIDMKGQAKLGTKMSTDMNLHLDLLNGKNSNHNFKDPVFQPIAEANATIGLTASLGFPVEIGFEVDIKAIHFTKKVALTETPKVIGHIEASLGTNAQEQSCKGLPWDLQFENNVHFTAWDTNLDLYDHKWDLAHGCINLPDHGKSSSSVSAVVSSTISSKAGSTIESSKATSTATSTTDHVSNSASGTTASAPAGTGNGHLPFFDPFGPIQSQFQSVLHAASDRASAVHASASAVSRSASVSRVSSQSIITPTPNVSTSQSSHISSSEASESVLEASSSIVKSASATVHSGSAAQSTSATLPAGYSISSIAAPAGYSTSSIAAPAGYSTSSSIAAPAGHSTSSFVTAPAGYSTSSTLVASTAVPASSVVSAKSSSTTCTEEADSTKAPAYTESATTLSSKIKSSTEEKSSTFKASSTSVKSALQYTPDVQPTASVY